MRKETDLRQVKATSRALLMPDIGKTDFSPMIVKEVKILAARLFF